MECRYSLRSRALSKEYGTMNQQEPREPLDFENIEHQLNLDNLEEMAREIPNLSVRLATRIRHFAAQFDIPEEDFWLDLEANSSGPLAAVLSREARRQNVHEKAAAEYVRALRHVSQFSKLPSSGPNALYVNSDGLMVTRGQLAGARPPSKSIDFRWKVGSLTCYAAQKYTKVGGGNQDSQFNEVEQLLRNFLPRTNNDTALFVLVDGPYYNETKLARLKALARQQSPFSYVAGINDLHFLLNQIVAG